MREAGDESYDDMLWDIFGRMRSMAELSLKGLWISVGVYWRSIRLESRVLVDSRIRLRRERTWSSESESESKSTLPALRARAWAMPSSDEAIEEFVKGLAGARRISGVLLAVEVPELLGGVASDPFFLVMWSARTGPSWAVVRAEFSRLIPGICMRIGLMVCLGSI